MSTNEIMLLKEIKDYLVDVNLRIDRLEQTIINIMKEKYGEDVKTFKPFGGIYE